MAGGSTAPTEITDGTSHINPTYDSDEDGVVEQARDADKLGGATSSQYGRLDQNEIADPWSFIDNDYGFYLNADANDRPQITPASNGGSNRYWGNSLKYDIPSGAWRVGTTDIALASDIPSVPNNTAETSVSGGWVTLDEGVDISNQGSVTWDTVLDGEGMIESIRGVSYLNIGANPDSTMTVEKNGSQVYSDGGSSSHTYDFDLSDADQYKVTLTEDDGNTGSARLQVYKPGVADHFHSI
jgi:hypothetical protein